MGATISNFTTPTKALTAHYNTRVVRQDPLWLRLLLMTLAFGFLTLFVIVPLALVFAEAFKKGWDAYLAAATEPYTLLAVKLTLLTAAFSVVGNTLFGLAAAWAITKFRFRGKSLLITLIDLPFAVSPVIAGLIYVLIFGNQGWFPKATLEGWFAPLVPIFNSIGSGTGIGLFTDFAGWLADPKFLFATPSIVVATMFVTFPFVARELIPLMQAQGNDEEQAAVVLGANGWQIFWRVTLPNIKWALIYGVILCNARAMGEFGAVSVVSGHIRGQTNTIPLHIEILYNEYNLTASFAVASLLTLLALVTLTLKSIVEWYGTRDLHSDPHFLARHEK